MDRLIFRVARGDTGRFQRSGRRVEAGVQDRAVALGGAIQNLRRFLQQRCARAFKGEPARDGASYHAPADHDRVECTRQGRSAQHHGIVTMGLWILTSGGQKI